MKKMNLPTKVMMEVMYSEERTSVRHYDKPPAFRAQHVFYFLDAFSLVCINISNGVNFCKL
jgi:hypothetical protein